MPRWLQSDACERRSVRVLLETGRFCVAVVLVAIGAALFALLFRGAVNWVFVHAYGAHDVLAAFEALPLYARVAIPALGGGVAGLLGQVAVRFKGGQGVGQVMEAVVLGNVHISLRLTVLKAIGSWSAIVSGGSVGREGSIIQFGGGFGAAVARTFRLPNAQTRSLVAAGSAAGFAAAYNTPLAAVLFVIEVVTGLIALEVMVPTIIATPIATAILRLVIGGGPIYGQRTFHLAVDTDLWTPALLGLLSGLAGPTFMALLALGEVWFKKLAPPSFVRACVGGLLVGALAVPLPWITGNGYEAINVMLGGELGAKQLLILLLAKAFATVASVSSGSPGGVFTPTLFLGAALGGAVGHLSSRCGLACSVDEAQADSLIGMAAFTAATTHAPMMAAVMIFELSGDYALVLPLLVATALATLVSRGLRANSIYVEELRRQGKSWHFTVRGLILPPSEAISRYRRKAYPDQRSEPSETNP